MTNHQSNIDNVRASIREHRKSLDADFRKRAARVLAERLQSNDVFNKSTHIACYWAVEGELSCEFVIESLWQAGKHCYLPVIDFTAEPKMMLFREFRRDDALGENRYGIPEPIVGQISAVEDLDCVITPLVGFDKRNNRIGMGGGFYDRAFASNQRPYLIGAAYELQELELIQPQPWDIPLNEIIAV